MKLDILFKKGALAFASSGVVLTHGMALGTHFIQINFPKKEIFWFRYKIKVK